jgi:hypothetical protein
MINDDYMLLSKDKVKRSEINYPNSFDMINGIFLFFLIISIVTNMNLCVFLRS